MYKAQEATSRLLPALILPPPEVQKPATATNLQTGVSTNSALLGIGNDQSKNLRESIHWYALRATYGREKRDQIILLCF